MQTLNRLTLTALLGLATLTMATEVGAQAKDLFFPTLVYRTGGVCPERHALGERQAGLSGDSLSRAFSA